MYNTTLVNMLVFSDAIPESSMTLESVFAIILHSRLFYYDSMTFSEDEDV